MEKGISPILHVVNPSSSKHIMHSTTNSLFDLTKPVPNELALGTVAGVFLLSVGLVIYINYYAKKHGYKK